MKKFEIGKQKEIAKFNAWYSYCLEKQIPFITIKNRNKYSTIEWDYINLNPMVDRVFNENGEENKKLFLNVFKKYSNKKSKYTVSNLTLFVENITIENSKQYAEDIFDIIYKHLN
jgi:hypothetical protein|tara:strand:- start:4165 stop:4509 length:345 start_codon:yes stop_codon:yes gene_type:complete